MQNISIWGFSDPFSSWSHLLTAFAALIGGVFLWRRGRGSAVRTTALIVYSFALVFLFSMSGVFHLLEYDRPARAVLQRLDHAGIWVLIAGTFTPIHAILFRSYFRWLVLLVVWTVAITGLVLEVVFFSTFPEWLALTLFLGLGWVGVVSDWSFRRTFPKESPRLLLAGGLLYSIGALIDYSRWPILWPGVIGAHEIFHIFVTLGAFCHWKFIYRWATHPAWNEIQCDVYSSPDGTHRIVARNDLCQMEGRNLPELKAQVFSVFDEKFRHKYGFRIRYTHYELHYFNVDI